MPDAVGSLNAWRTDEFGDLAIEAGWAIQTPYQGRGWAGRSVALLLATIAPLTDRDRVYAYPGVDNAPSNAVARRAGFELLGPVEIEYPAGVPFHANRWRFDLRPLRRVPPAPPRTPSG